MLGNKAIQAVALGALLSAAVAAQAATTPVVVWNQAALEEVRSGRLGPPVVARALAIAHTCMYDAWTSYDARAIGAVVTTKRRPAVEHTDANKAKAVSYAGYRCLVNLFPAGAERLTHVMRGLGYDPKDTTIDDQTPQGIGNAAAAAVIANRRHDGSNQYGDLAPGAYNDYTGYASANDPMPFCLPTTPGRCAVQVKNPARWQPLINDRGVLQRFIAPHWENVRPFALESATQFDQIPEVAAGPNYLQNFAFYLIEIQQMLAYSAGLTMQQKVAVEYWADGPASELPPGHWSLFAQFVSQRDRHTIDQDVKMFFAMQNASFDAGILAWHMKRKYDGVRPITAVRLYRQGMPVFAWGGPGQPVGFIDGGKWTPYNPGSNLTPAFPGYVSGHSTFSAASAAVLSAFTGSDHFGFSTTIPPNFGRVEPGVPAVPTVISYPTFTAAVTDAGLSRLLGGIHFSDDNTAGQALGYRAGQQAWAKARFLFDGGMTVGASSAGSVQGTFLTWSHTVEQLANRLVVVGVSTADERSYATGVTYAGRPMTRLGVQNGVSMDNRVELWYMVAPPVGTSSVRVNLSNSNGVVGGAMNFAGVHQSQPFGVLRSKASASPKACVTLANESAPLVASVLAANSDAQGVSADGGHSTRWLAASDKKGSGGAYGVIGTGVVGPSGPVADVCQNLSVGRRWAMLAVPLKPALAN